MSEGEKLIKFRGRDFKGSRYRCLLLTSQSGDNVRTFLHELVAPHAAITPECGWRPLGFRAPGEVRLEKRCRVPFLKDEQREELASWWLKNRQGANTPNWDLVAQCRVGGKPALVLVEAKAHAGELGENDRCQSGNEENSIQIAAAIRKANEGLDVVLPGWALERDSRYQLSNRFALSWKVASMGIPVILVYLGFLDTWDMADGSRTLLTSPEVWRDCLVKYAEKTVPRAAWGRILQIRNGQGGETPFIPLIRAARVEVMAELVE